MSQWLIEVSKCVYLSCIIITDPAKIYLLIVMKETLEKGVKYVQS